MIDRVSRFPGRVVLTPVPGQANTYDLSRADEPSETGTPLNKATLLKDTTAALFDLGTAALPDDALSYIGRTRLLVESGTYLGSGTSGSNNPCTLTFGFKPEIIFVCSSSQASAGAVGNKFFAINGQTKAEVKSYTSGDTGLLSITLQWNGNTVSWYGSSTGAQLNLSMYTYRYLALGKAVNDDASEM